MWPHTAVVAGDQMWLELLLAGRTSGAIDFVAQSTVESGVLAGDAVVLSVEETGAVVSSSKIWILWHLSSTHNSILVNPSGQNVGSPHLVKSFVPHSAAVELSQAAVGTVV